MSLMLMLFNKFMGFLERKQVFEGETNALEIVVSATMAHDSAH